MPTPRRRRPRRRRHSRAWLAALVYGAFAATAVALVAGALRGGLPSLASSDDGGSPGVTFGPGSDELALRTIGARAQRSTLGVGGGTGFVAWEANGLTLVLTARPAGGWKTGVARSLTVSFGGRSWRGTLARADAASGLGLVRVPAAGVADPLWEDASRTAVRTGERLAVVGRTTSRTVEVAQAARRRLYLGTSGLGGFAGAPVLNAEGRLVGVIDAGGAAVPIARACGVIRRC
jgi:hypothetical protein